MNSIIISLRQHRKLIIQIALGLLFVALGIYFFKHEIGELTSVRKTLASANPSWISFGILLLLAFTVIQGMMYQQSFRTIGEKIRLSTGISLYLKRNLVSVFLPAGVLTNLLFFNESVERKDGVSKTQIYFASSIFSVCSVLSGILVGIPAVVWIIVKQSVSGKMIVGVSLAVVLIGLLTLLIINFIQKGRIYLFLEKRAPVIVKVIHDMSQNTFDRRKFFLVVGLSVMIEVIGIAHLYIAVKALGGSPTLAMATIGYALAIILLMTSPFLRGIGVVEVALTYALTQFGLTPVLALSAAFLFRFFEFWSVLVFGIIALVTKRDSLLVRVFPAFLLFILGLVNIISGITPALPERLDFLVHLIPLAAIQASVWMVIFSGIFMLAISIYLVRGQRNAWITALVLSIISLLAHMTKGIDWEEASLALLTLISLLYHRRQYFIRPNFKIVKRGFFAGLTAVSGVILFGSISFWFMNSRHFGHEFSVFQSLHNAVTSFFLLNTNLHPLTSFGHQFLLGMNLLGGISIVYFLMLLFRPLIYRPETSIEEDLEKAKALVQKYGRSSLDYFKTYYDKKFWFSDDSDSFVSFNTSGNYAIALGNPVCKDIDLLSQNIIGFDAYCRRNGLRSAFYRIPERYKTIYEKEGKKLFPIGEVAVVDLGSWTMEGSSRRGLRNEVSKLSKTGYTFHISPAPQKDSFLQQLKAVSDEWLKDTDRKELVFSQGIFDEKELKNHTILSLQNPEEKVVGFVNLIPDYAPGEANFDLMRKTLDSPNGTMDFLFINMFEYLKNEGFTSCNMGMAPLSGIDHPENLQERVVKLAYEKIKQFGHYKSLRNFKEKFDPSWEMMYLAYDAAFDLVALPNALENLFEV